MLPGMGTRGEPRVDPLPSVHNPPAIGYPRAQRGAMLVRLGSCLAPPRDPKVLGIPHEVLRGNPALAPCGLASTASSRTRFLLLKIQIK